MARTIEEVENATPEDPCLNWNKIALGVLTRLRESNPELLRRFKVAFRREEFVLDTHLVAVFEPLSAVDRLASVVEGP